MIFPSFRSSCSLVKTMRWLAVLMLVGINAASAQLRLPEQTEASAVPAGDSLTAPPLNEYTVLPGVDQASPEARVTTGDDGATDGVPENPPFEQAPGIVRLTAPPTPIAQAAEPPGVVRMSSAPAMADGFFFLSTHQSPQTFPEGLRFCPVVSRHDNCGPFRGSSFDELRSQIVPGIPVCIYVHGSFVDMASSCKASVETWGWV